MMIYDKRLLYVAKAASLDDVRGTLRSVYIENSKAVATNRHIMFWAEFDKEQKLEYESSIQDSELIINYLVNPQLIKMAFKISANNSKKDLAALNKISIRAKVDMVEIYARSKGNDYFLRHKLDAYSWVYPNWQKAVDEFKDLAPVDKMAFDSAYLNMIFDTKMLGKLYRGFQFSFHGQNKGATFTFEDSQHRAVNGLLMPIRVED